MGDLELISATGLGQLDTVEPVACSGGQASTGLSLVAQSAYLQLVRVSRPKTVTKLSCYTSAATTDLDMSIFDENYNEVATIAAPFTAVAGGLSTGTLATPFTYQPGIDYYHVILPTVTVSVIRGYTGVAVILNAGSGPGTQRSLSKAVAQNTVPSSVASPAAAAVAIWVAGHN